jgi:transposase
MGRRKQQRQLEFWVTAQSLPRSPGHPFYEQLNQILDAACFDRFCEEICRKFYAEKMGRPSIPPGVCFRMLMVGYFEKIGNEKGIAWRCSDSLSLRSFLELNRRRRRGERWKRLHRKRGELVERSF